MAYYHESVTVLNGYRTLVASVPTTGTVATNVWYEPYQSLVRWQELSVLLLQNALRKWNLCFLQQCKAMLSTIIDACVISPCVVCYAFDK
ncbi:MAG: hypothetical protein SPI30_08500 [Prevotella sp.]|nr:hypothetical protein [Prevotella sp.]